MSRKCHFPNNLLICPCGVYKEREHSRVSQLYQVRYLAGAEECYAEDSIEPIDDPVHKEMDPAYKEKEHSQVSQLYQVRYLAGSEEGYAEDSIDPIMMLHHSSKGEAPFFGENIRVCHGFPAQNRFTGASPFTCGHFASNYSATTSAWDTAGKGPGKGGSARGRGPVDRIEMYIRGPDAGTK